ncbi:3-hydroxyacyl-CoA dehydrogenase type-2-like [Panonychus citri]|uniref:3-hydroxyacyl-CoA dehydrogenase type-2-like n=1 Tax=Panonychus citri TaxID=50023 RepID=UPI0023081FC4|nr:3-hydroxyacyl-CoA dehydrogenase type-2-like [Panonychus citri]
MASSLKGLVAFVTGGSSGLGRATCLHLLSKGATGCYSYDLQAFPTQQLDRSMSENIGKKMVSYRGDVRDSEKLAKALNECKKKFGKIDAVINCAAVSVAFRLYNFKTNVPQKLDDFKATLDINVMGTYNVCRLAVSHLASNEIDPETGLKGIIINTSGIAGQDGQIGQTTYAASAGAIDSLTYPLAREFSLQKIRCVSICVGYFDTPVLSTFPDWAKEYLVNYSIAPKMIGSPDHYATLVEDIITNPFINKTTINLDAGMRPQVHKT